MANPAKTVDKVDAFSNFEQYGFDKPDILRMDCTNDIFKHLAYFDAIVCDPPYGIRASAKETGLRDARVKRREEIVKEKEANKVKDGTVEPDTNLHEEKVEAKEPEATRVENTDPLLQQDLSDVPDSNQVNDRVSFVA